MASLPPSLPSRQERLSGEGGRDVFSLFCEPATFAFRPTRRARGAQPRGFPPRSLGSAAPLALKAAAGWARQPFSGVPCPLLNPALSAALPSIPPPLPPGFHSLMLFTSGFKPDRCVVCVCVRACLFIPLPLGSSKLWPRLLRTTPVPESGARPPRLSWFFWDSWRSRWPDAAQAWTVRPR